MERKWYRRAKEYAILANDIYMNGNLHLCRFNDNVVSIYNELENNDYIHLKEKVEEYFDRLGNDCIYDKENK